MSSVHHINETEEDMGQRNLSMRSPMQWDNTSHAGFCKCTKGQPWMPLNPQYRRVNVEVNVYSSADFFLMRISVKISVNTKVYAKVNVYSL